MLLKRFYSSASAVATAICIAAVTDNCSLLYEPIPEEKKEEEKKPVISPEKNYSKNMVLIRAKDSSFSMGSPAAGKQPDWTKPAHPVRFTYNYWMDTTEVTQNEYDSLMAAIYTKYNPIAWDQHYGSGGRNPVFSRNWYDAALYCNARSKRDRLDTIYRYADIAGTLGVACRLEGLTVDIRRKGYRLPTEAEWEYACRARTAGKFYWGGEIATGQHAWYSVNSNNRTHPVAEKQPNGFGLYDMCGNVTEWCIDWYKPYSEGGIVDPSILSGGSDKRIVRGGSALDESSKTCSVSRDSQYPYSHFPTIGFRVVLPADTAF